MNQREARKIFNRDVKPHVVAQYSKNDKPAINEAWGIWLDDMCRSGEITEKQYHNWTLN